MPSDTWFAYLLIMTAIAYTPGPMTMFSMSSSLRNGFARTVPAIAGGSCAYLTQMAVVYLGLGVVVQGSSLVFNAVKWIGVVYLVVLAVKNWRKPPLSACAAGERRRTPLFRQFCLGYATGMSNPKSVLVFTVLFPHFIDPAHYTRDFLILAASFFVIQGSSATAYALFGAKAFRWLRERGLAHVQGRVTSAILACAAGMLAVSEK
ncbi:Lysine exporter protein (LYSE/YGGA) [Desulfovibrio sp. X2]|uniref:LysE family translocator n=1 Tax=Desulfovibrio sp. X2 TaxID=941449 RepID=UPI0003586EEB|nr:LysE family translocator [Desulfovibrio sp. X2]EPR43681.1 Lysine exporter protein (LYSE/YGGA) [Desulfovibrio sp. X2]